MKVLRRSDLEKEPLPGRVLQKAIGRDSASASEKMTVCFARYAGESGPMEPHNHAGETVYIIEAKDGWVRTGPSRDDLPVMSFFVFAGSGQLIAAGLLASGTGTAGIVLTTFIVNLRHLLLSPCGRHFPRFTSKLDSFS